MKKTLLLSLLCFIFFSAPFTTFAQQRQVTGTIRNADKEPVAGASIQQVGSNNLSIADAQGQFSISTSSSNPTFLISAIGYTAQEMQPDADNIMNVILVASQSQKMEEVVVTAMGIRREKKALGYAAQTVNAEDLTINKQQNVVNALQGKVAGVNIESGGGAPGQGARIVIRGINSLDPSRPSQPLFIVDGVEIDNSTTTVGGGDTRGMSNRAADINPDDIETISILKGGAATALYGIRAANGAVIITTKSAKAGRLSVAYNGSYGMNRVNKIPDVQSKYTQGYLGVYDKTSFWPSWGPLVDSARLLDNTHPAQLFNNYKQAYRTGTTNRQNITLGGGTDKMQGGGSFAYNNDKGVIPFSDYTSYNARAFSNINFSDKFKAGFSINYINSGGSRVNSDRYGEQLIYWSPRWDVMDYINADGTQKTYGPDNDNPVYTLATNRFFDNVNRAISSINLQYTPFNWLSFNYRFGNDIYTDHRDWHAPGPVGVVGEILNGDNGLGFVSATDIKNRNITSTFIANFNKNFNRFSVNLNLGHDLIDRKYNRQYVYGDTLGVRDLFTLQNTKKITGSNYQSQYRNIGLFADVTLGYNDLLFLNLTGRNDFTSNLAKNNRSYFYPSASISYIFSEMFKNRPDWFSYGKARVSYATVAKDGEAYAILSGYAANTDKIGSIITFTTIDQLGNLKLRPEFTNTIEGGMELRFLKNRIGIDFTIYKAASKDLIVPVYISNATGFDNVYLNAGDLENKGIEATLSATPVKTSAFTWDFNVNFTRNKSRVIKLNDDLDEIVTGSQYGYSSSSVTMKLVPEYQYGSLFGRTYKRYYGSETDDGITVAYDKPLVIGANGFPIIDTKQRYLGTSEPKFIISTLQNLRYKNITLSALFDARYGVKKYNQFANFMAAFGASKMTENRNQTIVFDGVLADGTKNTKAVYLGQNIGPDGVNYGNGYYRNVYRGVSENFVEDAGWVRLRSLTLAYDFTKLIAGKAFVKGASLSLTGTNLWLKTKFTGFDPESSSFNAADNSSGGFSGFTYPAVRSALLTLNLQF